MIKCNYIIMAINTTSKTYSYPIKFVIISHNFF